MYIQGRIIQAGDDLTEVINIRTKVFVEEYKNSYNEEFDQNDNIAIHAVAYESRENSGESQASRYEKTAIATGRIIYDGDECIIDRIAVLKKHRNKGYGDFIVRLLLNKAFMAGIKKVYAISYEDTKGFYEKIGFIKSDNDTCQNTKKCKMEIDINSLIKKCSVKNDNKVPNF